MLILYFVIPGIVTAAAAAVGVARAEESWPGWVALGSWLGLTVATGALFATGREPGVTDASFVGGILVSSTMVGALPALI